MKKLMLVLTSILCSSSALAFDFIVGNNNFPGGVTATCQGNVIEEMVVAPGTKQTRSIKYAYDPSAAGIQPTCHFNSGGTNLGSITLRLMTDKRDNDIVGGYITNNNLQKRYGEITQTNHNVYVYFHNH